VPLILLGARLVLAAVLGGAGLAKLLDRPGTRRALEEFGASQRWAAPLAVVLPVAEGAVALALLPTATAWWGALGALGLLLLFTAAVGRVLARGERPDCRCFGQFRTAPVGRPTLARNGALVAVAAFVAVAGRENPGASPLGWLEPLGPADRVLGLLGTAAVALLAALTALATWMARQQRDILVRLDAIETRLDDGAPAATSRDQARPPDKGLPVGAPAPAFILPDLTGAARSLPSLIELGRPVLLLFAAPECDPCAALAPEIARWQREHARVLTAVVLSSGRLEEQRARLGALAPSRVLLQAGSEVADAYRAGWSPAAVLVGPSGRIASPVAYGDQAIHTLVARAVAAPGLPVVDLAPGRERGPFSLVRSGPPGPGDPAPPVARPDLEGRTVALADYRGRDTLVVFWQPNCPHCQRLAEHLRRWEAEPPRGAPRLLIVSSGSVEANRALGFQSPVVLDEGFAVGKAFGVRGTPSAILIDAEGRIASTVGVGTPDVLALAGAVAAAGPRRSDTGA
jgi:thiol-disulfide isomerase/thioredoxin